MKLAILAVGHRMPAWVKEAFAEYAKRMPREMPLQLKELKPAQRSNATGDTPRWLKTEAEHIEAALPQGVLRVVLDERGRSFPTRTLADHLERWRNDGRDIAFIIGGADGLELWNGCPLDARIGWAGQGRILRVGCGDGLLLDQGMWVGPSELR